MMKKSSLLRLVLSALSALSLPALHSQNLIQNGGFEVQNPPVQTTPPSYSIFPVSGLPGWSTTAGDQKVEVWSSGYQGVTTITQPDGFYPNGGSYFAELNANVPSTLYQSVAAPSAGALSYSFWHRGRNGVDTMGLQIQALIGGTWQQIFYQVVSTGQTWTLYQGKDIGIVTAGEQLRFNFVSINGTTGSIGNFLDNVAFGILAFPDPVTPEPSPELSQDANEGLATQAGVSDQLMSQVKEVGPMLYNRFALVRATRQAHLEPISTVSAPEEPDSKEVKDPKQVVTPAQSFKATLNGHETTIAAEEHLPWELWGQGNGVLSDVPSINSIPGQHNAGGAFLVGLDYYLTQNITVGVYSGYLLNRQNFTGTGGGSAWSDGLAYGGYLSYSKPQGGFYADGVVGGGGFQTQVTRPINLYGQNYGSGSSQPTGNFLMLYGDTGYDLKRGFWTLGPIGTFQFSEMNVPSVQETDPYNLNLKANSQSLTSLFSGLGGHISYMIPISRSVFVIPEIRCFWNHEFDNSTRNVSGSYQALPGQNYSFSDTFSVPNSFSPEAGFTATLGKNLSTSLFYTAGLGSGTSLQAITFSANLNF